MKSRIKKILKETDFDWIGDIPSFFEITEPVTQRNPKNSLRLYWTNGTGEENGVWSDNWYTFKNDSEGINNLIRYVKILKNGYNASGYFSIDKLIDLYLEGGNDYIVTDWMKSELNKIPTQGFRASTIYAEKRGALDEMLKEDLYDMGILTHDSYSGDYATIERWWVHYFDEAGVEYKTKLNIL